MKELQFSTRNTDEFFSPAVTRRYTTWFVTFDCTNNGTRVAITITFALRNASRARRSTALAADAGGGKLAGRE